jgi:hypothetical protein
MHISSIKVIFHTYISSLCIEIDDPHQNTPFFNLIFGKTSMIWHSDNMWLSCATKRVILKRESGMCRLVLRRLLLLACTYLDTLVIHTNTHTHQIMLDIVGGGIWYPFLMIIESKKRKEKNTLDLGEPLICTTSSLVIKRSLFMVLCFYVNVTTTKIPVICL